MSNLLELRDGAGESSSRRMRKMMYDGVKALIDAHFARFPPNRYESEVYLPEDVLVHMDILDEAEQSHNLVHKITVDKQIPNCHKVAFASSYELDRHSKLSSMFSANNLKIHHADTFPTSDQHYSLDLFVVEGFYGMHIDDISRMLDGAWTSQPSTKEPKYDNDIDLELLAIREIISPEHAHLYRGTYQGKEIVRKELQVDRSFESTEFWRGIKILSGLRHPHLVRFLGANTRNVAQGTLGIVTEYIPGGNLFDYLQRNHENLTLSQRLKIALQISKGIEYLHGQLIIHKDINPSNILMDIDNVVKVDLPTSLYMAWAGKSIIPQLEALFHAFQLAEMNTPKIRRWTKFTGPEAMNTRKFGDRSDVYSFGIVLCVILTAKLPYETLDNLATRQTALRVLGGARPELPSETNPRLKNLIDKCLDEDSMYRPHISDVRRVLESLISELNTPTLTPTLTPIVSASPSTSNSTSTLVLRNRFEVLAHNPDS